MHGLKIFRSRFFRNLYASYAALLLVTAILIGVLVDQRLERSLESELESQLRDQCVLLSPMAERAFGGEADGIQEQLARLGQETGVRITLIGTDGRVLADSGEDPAAMDDHGSRPEVLEAKENGFGVARRFSRTVRYDMLYAAQALTSGDEPVGFVRVALPLRDVVAQLGNAANSVILGTALGFLVALALGLFVARKFTTPIAAITRTAEELRAGDFESRVQLNKGGELGLLADTLNRMGEEVTQRIATISQDDAQLRAMLAGMVEGVVAVDEQDAILFCNGAARALLEIEVSDPEGRKLWELAPIADLEELLEQARAAASPSNREVELYRGERDRVIDVHASPFQGGGLRGLVVVLHDITDLRRLERIRRDFVANVSHELKTPLTSIKGFVETLLSGALHDEENNERFLLRIDANVQRLNHLVSDLLSLARIESDEEGAQRAEIDCVEVLQEVSKRHAEALSKKSLEYEVEAEGEVLVIADREALVQVLDNLLDNAIKYTPPSGTIHVRVSAKGERALIEVVDTGIGIPQADLDRVFERFYRVDKARSRELGGTGLGLSIVKNLVLKMDGDVFVESEEGAGSRFRIELPLARQSTAVT